MRPGIKQARTALRRGDAAGALVYLWNELEPARLDGDRRSLEAIGELAAVIAEGGDAGQQAEARRLLDVVQRAAGEGEATSVVGAEVSRGGGYEPRREAEAEPEEAESSGFQWGGLVWLLILIGVVLVNVLSGTQD